MAPPRIAAVHPAGHVRRGDHEPGPGRPHLDLPSEQPFVEGPPSLGVADTELEERELACHRSLPSVSSWCLVAIFGEWLHPMPRRPGEATGGATGVTAERQCRRTRHSLLLWTT